MTKIGILTYHNTSNRGAILQAYCLWKILKKNMPDNKVEIIDYRTLSGEIIRIYSNIFKHPLGIIKKIRDFNTCTDFLRSQNALSTNRITTNNHKKAISFLKKQDYDMIITGSDTIWRIQKKRYFPDPPTRPFPNAYFLDPSLNVLKVSYAASANKTDFQSLSDYEISIFKKYISAFDKISVRDNYTEKMLRKLGIYNISRVPDPTILTDIPRLDVTETLRSNGVNFDTPILGLHRIKQKLSKKIVAHYHNRGYQIVSPVRNEYADVNLFGKTTPFEYYTLYQHFDMLITSSFHSTIFSIKNRTPFLTIDFSAKRLEDKTHSLLDDFSLLNRYINASEINPYNIIEHVKTCEKPLNQYEVSQSLNTLKEQGVEYIKELENLLNE